MAGLCDKAIKPQYPENKFRFGQKELQSKEFSDGSGLETYDFGARLFDVQIARWQGINQLAAVNRRWSTYNYAFDNPVRIVDRDGMQGEDANQTNDEGNQKVYVKYLYNKRTGEITKQQVSEQEYDENTNNGSTNVVEENKNPFGVNGNVVGNDGRILQLASNNKDVYLHHFIDNSNRFIGRIGGKIDANEIFSNMLKKDMAYASHIISPITFRNLVKNHGDWDLKNNKSTIYGLAHSIDKANGSHTTFLFNGGSYSAEDLGNFHYGATGSATWFGSELLLLTEAGKAQMAAGTSKPEWQVYGPPEQNYTPEGIPYTTREMLPPYGDDPEDQKIIKAGIQYYHKNGKN